MLPARSLRGHLLANPRLLCRRRRHRTEAYASGDEYTTIIKVYPIIGFIEQTIEILYGLCKANQKTTYHNFVELQGVE